MFGVVMQFHLWGIKTSFAVYELAYGSIFDYHFGPERIARKTEEIRTICGGDFYNNIGPAGDNMLGVLDGLVGKSFGNDSVERVFGSKKICHVEYYNTDMLYW